MATDATAADPSDTGTYVISRSGTDTTSAITVDFGMSGTAVQGTDYTLSDGTNTLNNSVTIAAGQSSATITLTVVPSIVAEPLETATLTIQGGSGYAIGTPSSANISITHNGTTAVLVVATDATAGEPSDTGAFEISRVGGTDASQPLTVSFNGRHRHARSDYVLSTNAGTIATATNTVVIPGGQSSVDITVTAANDNLMATETAVLILDGGSGYGVAAAPGNSATVSIMNENPDVVNVSAIDASATPPSDTAPTGSRARAGSLRLTVNFTTGGDATLGTDYTLSVGGTALTGNSVTIAAGQSYVDVILAVTAAAPTNRAKPPR